MDMKLNEYLRKEGKTHGDFANEIGVSVSYVTYLSLGRRKPSFDVLVKIHRATSGVVTFIDFF